MVYPVLKRGFCIKDIRAVSLILDSHVQFAVSLEIIFFLFHVCVPFLCMFLFLIYNPCLILLLIPLAYDNCSLKHTFISLEMILDITKTMHLVE